MTFDLTLSKSLSVTDRERLDAALVLCSARQLAVAIAAALDAAEGPYRVPDWTDEQLGQALATATLLWKASGGEGEVYRRVRERLPLYDLLIVDEVHKFIGAADCLHVLADLLKETGVPQLWTATGDLLKDTGVPQLGTAPGDLRR